MVGHPKISASVRLQPPPRAGRTMLLEEPGLVGRGWPAGAGTVEGGVDTWELDPWSCQRTLQVGWGVDSDVESGCFLLFVLQTFLSTYIGQTYQEVHENLGNFVSGNTEQSRVRVGGDLRASRQWSSITGKSNECRKQGMFGKWQVMQFTSNIGLVKINSCLFSSVTRRPNRVPGIWWVSRNKSALHKCMNDDR